MGITETSKFISLILRHKPEVIGITLDEHGWANVEDLIAGIQKTQPMDRELLETRQLRAFRFVLARLG